MVLLIVPQYKPCGSWFVYCPASRDLNQLVFLNVWTTNWRRTSTLHKQVSFNPLLHHAPPAKMSNDHAFRCSFFILSHHPATTKRASKSTFPPQIFAPCRHTERHPKCHASCPFFMLSLALTAKKSIETQTLPLHKSPAADPALPHHERAQLVQGRPKMHSNLRRCNAQWLESDVHSWRHCIVDRDLPYHLRKSPDTTLLPTKANRVPPPNCREHHNPTTPTPMPDANHLQPYYPKYNAHGQSCISKTNVSSCCISSWCKTTIRKFIHPT